MSASSKQSNQEVDERASRESPISSIAAIAERLAAEVPDEDWRKIPPDGSVNLDHYLYGHPKQENGR